MKNALQNHLAQNFPFLIGKKLLLATSGGLDSMVMVDLFRNLSFEIAIAHCNFQLRGLESFGDQNFVQNYAEANDVTLFLTQFDTEAFANDYKLSTQVAARELRYSWFYELLQTENYDYILTAHHADDNLETVLIHLIRGTGLDGLTGIPPKNDKVIRPLLAFSRSEIEQYANDNTIEWREDSSNASDKYLRNKIRHNLAPILKDLNPDFLTSFQKTQTYLQEAKAMVDDASFLVYQEVAKEKGTDVYFDLNQLRKLPNYKSYLYHWFNGFGFSAWEDIYDLVDAQSGKQVFSEEFRLLKNRDFLILSPIPSGDDEDVYFINKNQKEIKIPLKLSFSKESVISLLQNTAIFVDEDKIWYPLVLRRWKEGDVFQPLGMDGKSKKVSKFFKDEKLSLIEKENTWILCSDNQIVWIVGKRQDERFKIKNTTKNILKIQLK
ncbi:tRNA lysidine(34) synthetase TilS [Flavobacterium nackdongense]|uniref:tRNA(Ile)-lysidine synthase n=1 Tax=Flavobacterium nackdongense TaxID=2547394 RepID=A0A4P6Y9R5_9FLAO|nr:tRNA lysidine(34) synthetase TilS [Flavobacterium nackdongense]QBN17345.1 tRNA lysidine(34) synthetase TilS [Flavobacterium nackdongense]